MSYYFSKEIYLSAMALSVSSLIHAAGRRLGKQSWRLGKQTHKARGSLRLRGVREGKGYRKEGTTGGGGVREGKGRKGGGRRGGG